MRALVALSGGVDSSVAAALMVRAGHDVVGVTLKQWSGGPEPVSGCCTVADAEDARRVAGRLDIPYYVLDYASEFRDRVVAPFITGSAAGLTPNPCVECNRSVRFGALMERLQTLGCDVLVTGHHVRNEPRHDRRALLRGADEAKDQSYVLHSLRQHHLERLHFPIGDMTKDRVRRLAADLGLRTAAKPDSQDLCFVGGAGSRDFLRSRLGSRRGEIVDEDGKVIGTHDGAAGFTIGQRKGLGVAVGEPRYVIEVDTASERVVIGPRHRLLAGGCRIDGLGFVSGEPTASEDLEVQVRYRSHPVGAALVRDPAGWRIDFTEPVEAVAPGQSAVLYRGDEVVGGATITGALVAA